MAPARAAACPFPGAGAPDSRDSAPPSHSCPTIARACQCSDIMSAVLLDQYQRPLRNLRLSVTDRCNLRCSYCMPEPEYVWLAHEALLTFAEIVRLVDVFTSLGVDKVR